MPDASTIFVTYDGDAHWLECFANDQDAEHGDIVCPVGAGDGWGDLAARVAAHQAEHGCRAATDAS